MATLKEQYTTTVLPALKQKFERTNALSVPSITKITINARLSSKRDQKFVETLQNTLRRITGQEPVITKSRKSIAGFKLREGQPVGVMLTLRGVRMWNFLDKLVYVVFPRIRDFRGLPESAVDRDGNFNFGFREHIAFPEIDADEIESLHGLQIVITTTAKNHEEGLALFSGLGFPFKKADT